MYSGIKSDHFPLLRMVVNEGWFLFSDTWDSIFFVYVNLVLRSTV